MSFVSTNLADAGWEAHLDRDPQLAVEAWRAVRHLQASRRDVLISALNQRRGDRRWPMVWHTWISPASLQRGDMLLATTPVSSWARPNSDIEGNGAILRAISDVEVSVDNRNQGYDGSITPRCRGVNMRRVFLTDDEPRPHLPVELSRTDEFALEIGACSLSKCMGILRFEGARARLPFDPRIPGLDPHLYFSAIAPERWKVLFESRGSGLL
jgi:hypothetical protein